MKEEHIDNLFNKQLEEEDQVINLLNMENLQRERERERERERDRERDR